MAYKDREMAERGAQTTADLTRLPCWKRRVNTESRSWLGRAEFPASSYKTRLWALVDETDGLRFGQRQKRESHDQNPPFGLEGVNGLTDLIVCAGWLK